GRSAPTVPSDPSPPPQHHAPSALRQDRYAPVPSDGIDHSARQEDRRYPLRRRPIDSAPFSSLATGRAWASSPRRPELSPNAAGVLFGWSPSPPPMRRSAPPPLPRCPSP